MEQFEFAGYPVSVMRRPYQRTIGILVKPNGLIRVTAGRLAKPKYILKFLLESQSWIENIQREFSIIRDRYPSKKFVHGEKFLFEGEAKLLKFQKVNKKKYGFRTEIQNLICEVPEHLWEKHHPMETKPHLKDEILKFYRSSGRKKLEARVHFFSQQMELYPKKLSFRSQKSRWGSCGSNGHVSLNWRLIAAPNEILDYVVVHELAHLKHQDHSQRFWELVGSHCLGFRDHRKWLKANQYEFDFLAKKSELWLEENQ